MEGCDLVDLGFQAGDRTAVIDRLEKEESELGSVSKGVQKARLRREEEGLMPKNPLILFNSPVALLYGTEYYYGWDESVGCLLLCGVP